MRTTFLCLLVGLVGPTATADPTPRIQVVGDGMAWRTWLWRSLDTALRERGLEEFVERGDRTVRGGSTAAQWAAPNSPLMGALIDEIEAAPTVDIVHLTLGGVDLLVSYDGTQSQAEQDSIIASVVSNLEVVVQQIIAVRPEKMKVLLCEYDFIPRLLGEVTCSEQNAFLVRFAEARLALAESIPELYYLSNFGVLHATFGYQGEFEAGKFPLPGSPPDYDPLPGGNPAFCGDPAAFLPDGIHPNQQSDLLIALRAVDQFYHEWLATQAFHRGDGNADGTVDISDAIFTLGCKFLGTDCPTCDDAADSNDDGALDLSDAIYTLTWSFLGGPAPPNPHGTCGPDPTPDDLTCESFEGCP